MFEENITPLPNYSYLNLSLDEKKVQKYLILEKEININKKESNTQILDKMLQIKKVYKKVTPKPPIQKWDLKYIIISGNLKVAMINGKTLKEGDVINGAKILKITPKCVKLKTKKGSKCIYLKF